MISDINVKVEDTQRSMKQVLGKIDKVLRQLSLRQVFYVLVTGIGILLMLYIVMKIVF
jgi:tetrahydromethanopterin S-methyltransferase subunit G